MQPAHHYRMLQAENIKSKICPFSICYMLQVVWKLNSNQLEPIKEIIDRAYVMVIDEDMYQ